MKRTTTGMVMVLFGLGTTTLHAQAIDPDNHHAWGENIGFLNFIGAGTPAGSEEVFAAEDYLEGYLWSENAGWINMGSGSGPYSNSSGLDFGVNRDPGTGQLSGFAWGENIGWINFDGGALASPSNPARIEDNRFRGFAWSENTGWIILDDDVVYVGLLSCPADLTGDGALNFLDVSAFLAAFGAEDPVADFEQDGSFNFLDVSAFLSAYSAGCSSGI